MSLKEYTLEEVSKHTSESDCWIIFDNTVYNITKFLEKHPGGKNILMKFAGKDGSKAFLAKGKGKGHAQIAYSIRESLKIGFIKKESEDKDTIKPKL